MVWIIAAALMDSAGADGGATATPATELAAALTFHASFDGRVDADIAAGDARLHTAVAEGDRESEPGLHTDGKTRLAEGKGVAGDALEFTRRDSRWLYFRGAGNVAYSPPAADVPWSGSVSVWLRLDPEEDLEPGYADPIQITTRAWNDGAFFVDFDKEGDPREFRLGVFPDLAAWNPENREVPEDERPLVKVRRPPFSGDEWTHVVFTWEGFNRAGSGDGVAALYLNGKRQGEIAGRNQTVTWRADEELRLYVGLYFVGLLDELSCFNRALDPDEVARLFALRGEFSQIARSRGPAR